MKLKYCLLFLAIISCSVLVQAQSTSVTTNYLKDEKKTKVSVGDLVLIDNANHTLKLSVDFRYAGRKLSGQPESILFGIRSFSRQLKYSQGNNLRLWVVADGEPIDLGILKPWVFIAKVKNGKIRNYVTYRPGTDTDLILDNLGKGHSTMFLELMSKGIDLQTFLKIGKAKHIELMLGDDSFVFSEEHMKAIRNLVNRTALSN